MPLQIREERPEDIAAIHDLTAQAFAPMPFADGTEADAIDHMRKAGDLTLSLVVEQQGKIIGHVAFSPAVVGEMSGDWYSLGPISVVADHQRRGIGTRLALAGLSWLRLNGAMGCVLIGNPQIYRRMGFRSGGALTYRTLDRSLVHWITFDGAEPSGEIVFAPALELHDI